MSTNLKHSKESKRQDMKMNYRVLKPTDVHDYRRIRLESLQCFPECYGARYEQEKDKPELFFEQKIQEQSEHALMLGAFTDSDLIGLCGLIAKDSTEYILVQMYVKPAYAGNGVGQQLLTKAKETLRHLRAATLTLTVYDQNTAAIRSYEKAGFIERERVANEISMVFSLSETVNSSSY